MTDSGFPEAPAGFRVTPQLVLGLLVIAAGVLFTLDNLGVVYAEDYIRFWPTALIVVGLLKLWQSRRGAGSVAGLFFITVGGWLLLDELRVFEIDLRDFWPLLLVFFGAYLVWQGLSVRATPSVLEAGTMVSAMAILGAVSRGRNVRNFRGADLTAILGGCELDLRTATLEGEAVIDVFSLWGGIEIRVPEDWTIDSHIVPLLGGVEEKARRAAAGGPRVTLRGFAVMSGVEIKN
jgi:predicted membrane protein